jgi:hypothetical protein
MPHWPTKNRRSRQKLHHSNSCHDGAFGETSLGADTRPIASASANADAVSTLTRWASQTLPRSAEPQLVFDHSVWPDRHLAWICETKLAKHNLVAPDLAKEILEDLNR